MPGVVKTTYKSNNTDRLAVSEWKRAVPLAKHEVRESRFPNPYPTQYVTKRSLEPVIPIVVVENPFERG